MRSVIKIVWQVEQPVWYEGQLQGQSQFKVSNAHSAGINMLFGDWSVRRVGLKKLWTLNWHRNFDTSGPWTLAGGVQRDDWPQWMRRFKDY